LGYEAGSVEMIPRERSKGLAVEFGEWGTTEDRSLGRVRADAEREHILSVLRLTEGNRVQAARILGISRKTLWKKLKQLGASWPPGATER
jgi:DNA-binding NtrC family response regulator